MNIGFIFSDPILSGQSGIQRAAFNIIGHLLGAANGALDGVVIDFRKITPAINVYIPSRTPEQRNCCVLQTTFGNTQFKWMFHLPYTSLGSKTGSPTIRTEPFSIFL